MTRSERAIQTCIAKFRTTPKLPKRSLEKDYLSVKLVGNIIIEKLIENTR
ncbi:hypothetical protein QWZ13_11535 [Reinekea marina]|nr:hypothetical protein [Reinekea marina]MDN3649547.1 hypothetical protein [Reinekea marina]